MKELLEFYNARTEATAKEDLLTQVGHTVAGRAIDDAQLTDMVEEIQRLLDIRPADCLLDLCCGNGLITSKVAEACGYTLGVDFTSGLIDIAKANFATAKREFECLDVKRLAAGLKTADVPTFNKVMCYAALQHFTAKELYQIFLDLEEFTAKSSIIVLGFVPLSSRKWQFYDTWQKRAAHFRRVATGRELITKWWSASEIARVGARFGYQAESFDMPSSLTGMGYRFNVRLTRA